MASLEYLRTFWWAVVGVPLGGLLFVIIGRGIMQVIGFFAVIWPFSIPARAVLVTSSMGRLLSGGVQMRVQPDRLEFQGQTPGKNGRRLRMHVPRDLIRDVTPRGDYLLLRTVTFGFVPIPRSAFGSEADADRFVAEARIDPLPEDEPSA